MDFEITNLNENAFKNNTGYIKTDLVKFKACFNEKIRHSKFTIIAKCNIMRQESCFTDIKKPNVLHHPVQAKNLHFNP